MQSDTNLEAQQMQDQVVDILSKPALAEEKTEKPKSETVFSALLESNLPAEELSVTRLQHEAISITGAGIETTMRALSLTSFHILANPPVLTKLRLELDAAMPDVTSIQPYDALAQLPYLKACIDEGNSEEPGDCFRMTDSAVGQACGFPMERHSDSLACYATHRCHTSPGSSRWAQQQAWTTMPFLTTRRSFPTASVSSRKDG